MRQLVESLARLYAAGKVTIEHLQKMIEENKISQEEYNYIVSK